MARSRAARSSRLTKALEQHRGGFDLAAIGLGHPRLELRFVCGIQLERLIAPTGQDDELALEFDDSLVPMKGTLQESARNATAKLDFALEAMSGEANAALWTCDALASSDEWRSIRRLARAALEALEE